MTQVAEALQKNLDSLLDGIGWGLFLIMTGGMLLVPGLPDGIWLAGLGALLLGLGAVRHMLGIAVSTFAMIIAAGFVVAGVGTMAGVAVPWFALLLIACGLALIADVIVRGRRP